MNEHTENRTETDDRAQRGRTETGASRRTIAIGTGVAALALAAVAVTTTQLTGSDDSDPAATGSGDTSSQTSQDDTETTDGGAPDAGGPAGICAAELVFEGETYTQVSTDPLVEGSGESLGTASVPPCDDVPGQEQESDAINTVEVFAVDSGPSGGSDADLIFADGAVWTLAP